MNLGNWNLGRLRARAADYRTVFGTPAGQRVLADILNRNLVAGDPFVPGDRDQTIHNLGRQRAALGIVGIIKMDEEAMLEIARRGADAEWDRESQA